MEPRNLDYVVSVCAAELLQGLPGALVRRVCTDSRQARPGDLFFALVGNKYDGHEFLQEVGDKGVSAVVIERARRPGRLPGCAVIAADNTRTALGRLAASYRDEFGLPVVAVGGSNGKTTTKNLIAAVLRQKFETLCSEASFNNDIGVPLTLLRLDKTHRAAVLEAGTNHPGELGPLVKMIRPHCGVITNVAREHLEFFGDIEGVAEEEGTLAELLPPDGKLFINGDSEWAEHISRRTQAEVVRVGFGSVNDWRARNVRIGRLGTSFQIEAPQEVFCGSYRTQLLGRHHVVDALFAVAVGEELGLGRSEARDGLAKCEPAQMRMQYWEANGVRVLDDSYNANADSVLAALEVLKDLSCKGRKVVVLGDMAELGAHTESAHAEVGNAAAKLGVGQLFAVGELASVTAQAARNGGLNRVMEFADVDAACAALRSFLKPGDLLLLKASRVARLERIAEALRTKT